MNEEIDEYDIYHQDFTTVSDWEVFIARVEEVLNDWHISKSHITRRQSCNYTNKWIQKFEEIKYQRFVFTLSYHTLEISDAQSTESANQEGDLENKPLSVQLLDGIWNTNRNFMDKLDDGPFPVSSWFGLKQYVMLCSKVPLVDESLIRIVMSSVNIAFANVDLGVPFFVKVRENWQQCYLGIFEEKDMRTNFDTIHLKRIPNQCCHLNGLTNLFKGKIGSPVPLGTVQMAAKFSYELKDVDQFSWKKQHFGDTIITIGDGIKKSIELPFGADQNPVQSVLLNVIWPKFVENAVIDSATYSDFDPIMAPVWTMTIKLREDFDCLLSDMINCLLHLLGNDQLLMDILGLSRSLGLMNPLNKITEAPITISKILRAAVGTHSTSDFKGPISDEILMPILYYIFPDAVEDDSDKYPENLEVEFKYERSQPRLCGFVKTSPEDGLVWRLSLAAVRLHDSGGLPHLAHLWYEFMQELQYRWEHRILVHGVADGNPSARTCLLHQKLQLLNCCIRRVLDNTSTNAGNSSEDEFFDCSDGEGADDQPLWDRPVGRLYLLQDATLKNGAPLYVPRTQDPAPKTEDQLEEDAELMVRLGDDARASELRARMMSASLLSDMEAFKAANPGAELCDFVRWYSPRDWKPDDGGALGERMLLPGNPWVETWTVARPVPAARQRRLFDENREAEQVLHYLRSRTVAAVVEMLLPAILRAGARRAICDGATTSGVTAGGCEQKRLFEIAARELFDAEKEVSKIFIKRLILGETNEGAPLDAAGRLKTLNASGGSLPTPARKEFSLRTKDQYAPQAMRAALATDIFLVGAFTERTVLL